MLLRIVRLEESTDGTFGSLLIDGHVFCVTLEPPDKENQRNISNIPPGEYVCKRINSPKYGGTFEVMNVTSRSHVLFHAGNLVKDTKGCILLARKFGTLKGERAVLNSGKTFKEFLAKMKSVNECNLEIIEL